MPRPPRNYQPDTVYHLISRFVAREYFIRTDEERRQYLRLFGLAFEKSDWRCFSYAVMSNHIHLAMLSGRTPLDWWLRNAHSPFAEWMNEKHQRIGGVFVRGPKVVPYRHEGALRLMTYLHCNPVRARCVSQPRQSTWTSHQAYLYPELRPPWLDVELGMELSGATDSAQLDSFMRDRSITKEEVDEFLLHPPKRRNRADEKRSLEKKAR